MRSRSGLIFDPILRQEKQTKKAGGRIALNQNKPHYLSKIDKNFTP